MKQSSLFQLDMESKASKFRKEYGYSETDPIDLEKFLIKNSILTSFESLSPTLGGMAIKAAASNRFIMVNHNHIVGKQNFTIAHELYHLFVQENFTFQHCTTGLFDKQTNIEEKRADYFAANVLLPKVGVYELIPQLERQSINKVSPETTFKIQQYYGVSVNATIFRLVDLGLVNRTYYDIYQEMGKLSTARLLGYDSTLYLKGNKNKVIGDYGAIARRLFHDRKISESYYLQLLNSINVDPFEKNVGDEE